MIERGGCNWIDDTAKAVLHKVWKYQETETQMICLLKKKKHSSGSVLLNNCIIFTQTSKTKILIFLIMTKGWLSVAEVSIVEIPESWPTRMVGAGGHRLICP